LSSASHCILIGLEEKTSHTVKITLKDRFATKDFVRSYVEEYVNSALGGDY
jgi:hypothetical protein